MNSLHDDTRRSERAILELLAGTGGGDATAGALAHAFSLLGNNGNGCLASLIGDGVSVLAAYPVPPAFDQAAWPADAALASLLKAPGAASAPLGSYDFWLAAVGVPPGRHQLNGIAVRDDTGRPLGLLCCVGASDTSFASSPVLPVLLRRCAQELRAREEKAALHQDLQRYRAATQLAGCRVLLHDRAGILREVSAGDVPGWHWQPDSIVGHHFSERMPPGPAALFASAQRSVLDTNDTWVGEYEIDLPQGRRWRELRVAAFDADHTLAVIRDITDSHHALEALRHSELRSRAILDALPDTLLINDANGVYLEAPLVRGGAWQYDTVDALGKRFDEVLPPSIAAQFSAGQATVLATGEACQDEYAITLDGHTHWREFRMVRLGADRTLTIVRDVTALKLALESLRESESRLRNVVRLAPVGIFWTDPAGAVLYGNRALRRSLQLTAAEGLGHAWLNYVHAADRPLVHDAWRTFVAGLKPDFHEEYRYLAPGRPVCYVRTHAVRLIIGEQTIGIMGIMLDLTAQRREEDERLQLQRTLKAEALGQLSGGIAHEFNNILASTLGFAALAQNRPATLNDTKLGHYLTQIVTAGERGRDLVKQMLAFAQPPSGAGETIDARQVIADTCQMLGTALPAGITLSVELSAPLAPVIGNAGDLRQVLLNLVLNARDAIGERGHIKVALLGPARVRDQCRTCHDPLDDDYVRLLVTDNGCGIEAAELGRIFDPFYSTKEVGSGAGLGLSVVHGVVHRGGGHVLTESVRGQGTTITVLLKPAAAAPSPTASGAVVTPPSTTLRAHIAVVDDEPGVGALISELLQTEGYAVDLFTSAAVALAAILDRPARYAALVTDLTMPQMGGLELAAAVRVSAPGLPIVVCTGYNDIAERGDVPGIARWFSKPLPIQAFLAAIAELTRRPHG